MNNSLGYNCNEQILSEIFDELFPVCRSITGPGVRRTIDILAQHMPLETKAVASGTKVFDWTVPPEWIPKSATLTGPDGETICDFADNNLHLLNYSEPFSGEMTLEELQPHLNSLPNMPDAIPYVTSYYQPRWGFCLSDRKRRSLREGVYRVEIDTEKKEDGVLNYAVTDLPGATDNIVLVTSYICHPSMANNELSGPLGLLAIYHALAALPYRHHTFRFLLIPETIGSITYMAQQGCDHIDDIRGGLVLTCLGGPNTQLSFKLSRRDWIGEPSSIDRLAKHMAEYQKQDFTLRPFTPISGSDERQFCSPGFNLPFIQGARTIYGEYEQYHTSADNKGFMRTERVADAGEHLALFLEAFDYDGQNLKNLAPYGEPQLGRRDLYPTINSPLNRGSSSDKTVDARTSLNRLLMVLSLSDNTRGLVEIAEHIGCSAVDLLPIVRELYTKGMLAREMGSTESCQVD